MKITTNGFFERYVNCGDGIRAYPKGGGYWDVVNHKTNTLLAAWTTKEGIRAMFKKMSS